MGKKVLVIDVETIDIRRLDIYELGYALLDLETGEIETKGFVLKEVYEADLFPKAYFYKLKKDRYQQLLDNNTLELMTVEEAKNRLNKVFKENREDIAYISAFNMGFDMRALNFTFNKYLNREGKSQLTYEKFMKIGMKPIDTAVLFAVYESTNGCYKCFCDKKKSDFYTPKGNIKTTAEIVYKYVSNDLDFEEEHMGIYDAEIEANIFEWTLSRCINKPWIVEKAHELTLKGTKPYLIFKNAR